MHSLYVGSQHKDELHMRCEFDFMLKTPTLFFYSLKKIISFTLNKVDFDRNRETHHLH